MDKQQYRKLVNVPVNFSIEAHDASELKAYQRGAVDMLQLLANDIIKSHNLGMKNNTLDTQIKRLIEDLKDI